MNRNPSGVCHARATGTEWPTTATTTSSSPAASIVRRKNGSVSMRPVAGSTTSVSWCSQPAWFSSEPRWWSTVNSTVPASRAAAPRYTADLPQYVPISSSGPTPPAFDAGVVQREAFVVGHEALRGARDVEQFGIHRTRSPIRFDERGRERARRAAAARPSSSRASDRTRRPSSLHVGVDVVAVVVEVQERRATAGRRRPRLRSTRPSIVRSCASSGSIRSRSIGA